MEKEEKNGEAQSVDISKYCIKAFFYINQLLMAASSQICFWKLVFNSSLIFPFFKPGNQSIWYIYIYIAKLSTPKIWLALSQTFSSGVLWLGFNKFLREIWGEKIANSNGFRLKQLKKSSLLIFPSESVSNSAKSLWTWEGTRFAETAWQLTIWNYGWIKNITTKTLLPPQHSN